MRLELKGIAIRKRYLVWIIYFLLLIFVAKAYFQAYQGISESSVTLLFLFIIVLILNVFLSLWITRVHLNAPTFSFAMVLFSFSWIIMGFNSSMPESVQRIDATIISFFPVIFLNFFIFFVSVNHYQEKRNKLFIGIQFVFSVLREASLLFQFFEPLHHFYFFGGLFLLMFFCFYIFTKERKKSQLWNPQAIRLLLVAAFCSIAPFVFGSLIPTLLNGEWTNLWMLSFVLILPITLGHILSQENLIIHRYWKVPLLVNFILTLTVLGIVLFFVHLVTEASFIQLFLIGNYLHAFTFFVYILGLMHTDYRKRKVSDSLEYFDEERHFLTHHHLQQNTILNVLDIAKSLIHKQANITGIALFFKEKNVIQMITESDSFNDFTLEERKQLFQYADKHNVEKGNNQNYFYFITDNSLHRTMVMGLAKESPFSDDEKSQIDKETSKIVSLLESHIELAKLRTRLEDRAYTSLEKAAYLRDLELADLYHDRISRYLHDEVQQNVLSLKQMSYTSKSIEDMRKRIEDVVEHTEESIKEKTIAWEGLPKNRPKIDQLLEELYKKLAYQYVRTPSKQFEIDSSQFEQESRVTQSLLYRVIKELLINMFKHSNAKNINVKLKKESNEWILIVADDGVGTDGDPTATNRFGLVSLYRQIDLLGGTFSINTAKGKGFKVSITLPSLKES